MAGRRPAGELHPGTRRRSCHGRPPQAAASGDCASRRRRRRRRRRHGCLVVRLLCECHADAVQPGTVLPSLCPDVAQHCVGSIQPRWQMQIGRHDRSRRAIGIACRQRCGDDQGKGAADPIDAGTHRPGPCGRPSQARQQHEAPHRCLALRRPAHCPGGRQHALHRRVPWVDKALRQAPMHEIANRGQLAVEARRALHGAHGQLNRCTADAAKGCRRLAGWTSIRTVALARARLAV